MAEQTLAILKPDCVTRGLIGAVIGRLEEAGFSIRAAKMTRLTKETAGGFYAVHRERPFFGELMEFMTEAPVIPLVLERENAVLGLREVIGATDPKAAKQGTIRADLAEDKQRNLIHASDSAENARIEINYFFSKFELI